MTNTGSDVDGNNCIHDLVKTADYEDQGEVGKQLTEYLSETPPNIVTALINQRNIYGNTPLMELLLCQEPTSEFVSQLIDYNGSDVNVGDNLKMTPIHKIVDKQFIPKRILDGEYLGEMEINIVEQQDQNEKRILKILLESGADVNIQDIFGRSPIFLANDIEVIQMLIRNGANVNLTDRCGRTLIHCALSMPNYGHLVRFFKEKIDTKLLPKPDVFGSTSLHYAAILSRRDIYQELGNRNDVCQSVGDNRGFTPAEILQRRMLQTNTPSCTAERQAFDQEETERRVQVVHFTEVVREEGAFLRIKPFKNSSEIYGLLHQPGLGAPWDEVESCSVKSTIQNFAQYVGRCVGEMDSRLKCTLFRTGSSSEGTKIGDPTEFDFVFCLDNFANFCRILEVPNKKGFAELHGVSIPEGYERFFDANNKCMATEIRLVFSKLLKRIVLNDSTWTSPNLHFDGHVNHLNEYDRPVFTVKLRWFGCAYKDEEISLDFVPAIRKRGWWPSDTDFERLNLMTEEIKNEGCLLLLQNPYFQSDTLLRISCSPAEICLLKSLPHWIRESYRLCKLLRLRSMCPRLDPDPESDDFPLFEADDSITSYMLKNCLFHTLSASEPETFTERRDNIVVQHSVVDLTVRILNQLDQCSSCEILPVYFIPNREDIFKFNFIEFDNCEEAKVRRLNHFHCLRRRAFVKIMLRLLGHKSGDIQNA